MKCPCGITQAIRDGDGLQFMTPNDRASLVATGILIGHILSLLGQPEDEEFLIDHLLRHAEEDPETVAHYTAHNALGLLEIAVRMRAADDLKN